MVGWHHQLDGHEFEQAPGGGERQGRLYVLQSMGLQRVGHNRATELNYFQYLLELSFASSWSIF